MPGKPDAAVNAIVRRVRKQAVASEGEWLPTMELTNAELRALLLEARQSAARECAEIADEIALKIDVNHMTGSPAAEYVARRILQHFGLEGK